MRYGLEVPERSVSGSIRKICPYVVAITLCVFLLFTGLGVLRLYSFRLECRLNSVNRQIESYNNHRVLLKHELSTLLSPVRLFGFSKEELGMTYASNVRVLKVDGGYFANAAGQQEEVPLTKTGPEEEGWFYFFLERAMAGE